ncbi:helix-turn-helix domain-containing protein [Mesorhizobium sp. SP-1A]|uniref:helix-turn-helix domain-containing protein n=1 Tax=Mesorhizobium sp. SP-1A TaxID=3077840 RepID=UPI0028F74393|nr:helix-turn-helix domain-containing protein [Mesorhizobium sp. SP-1A]
MSEAALRQLDRGLPRLDMRSPALVARQKGAPHAALPKFRDATESRSRAEIKAEAILAEARRAAAAILREAQRQARQIVDAASGDAAKIVSDARHEASAIVSAAVEGDPLPPDMVTVQEIIRDVARRHNVSPLDIVGPSRVRFIAEARKMAMVEAYLKRPDLSPSQIGLQFGNRERTTVVHALRKAGVYRGGQR